MLAVRREANGVPGGGGGFRRFGLWTGRQAFFPKQVETSKFAYCKLFGVYAGVIFWSLDSVLKSLNFLLSFLAVPICLSSWSVLDTENHVDRFTNSFRFLDLVIH